LVWVEKLRNEITIEKHAMDLNFFNIFDTG
jgi:hypothetical protein